MKAVKFLLGFVGLLIVGVLIVVLAAPSWLSSGAGRRFLLKQANAQMDGTVKVELLSVGWFKGLTLDGLSVDDKEGRPLLRVASVEGNRSLFQLARNYQDVGEVRLVRPQVYVYVPEPSATPSVEPAPSGPGKPGKAPEPAEAKEAGPLPIPEITAHVSIQDGTLYKVDPGAEPLPVVQNLAVKVDVDGLRKPISYEVSLDAGQGEGTIRGKGTLDLAPDGELDPQKALADAWFEIVAWDLADTLALIGTTGQIPNGRGTIHADLRVAGSAGSGLDIAARFRADDLAFSGGPLKGDTPELGDVDLAVTGRVEGTTAQFDPVVLGSALGSLRASASVKDGKPAALSAAGHIDLAAIAAQFPNSLGLKQGVTVNEGKVDLRADLVQEGDTATIEAAALMNRLEGISQGRPLRWDEPVEVRVKLVQGPSVLRVENLKAQTPFLQAEGRGDLADLSLRVQSDVGRALAELREFVDVQPWDAAGRLQADVKFTSDAVATTEGFRKPTRATARVNLTGEALTVRKGEALLVPPAPMTLQFETQVAMNETGGVAGVEAPSLAWEAWLGQGSLSARAVAPVSGGGAPNVEAAAAKGRIDLSQLHALLSALGAMPEGTDFGGVAVFQAALDLANQRLQLNEAQLSLAQFGFRQGEKAMPMQNLSVTTAGSLDLAEKSAAFPELKLETAAGTVTAKDVRVADWSRAAETLAISVQGDLDLARLVETLGGFAALPEATQVGGTMGLKADVQTSADGPSVSLDASLGQLVVKVQDEVRVQEPRPVTLSARVRQSATGTEVERLELAASPASLSLKGGLTRSGVQSSLAVDGDLALDLQAVTGYVQPLLGLDLVMAGKEERPFHFTAAWEEGKVADGLKGAEAELGLHADSIQAFGLNISDLDVPFRMEKGLASVSLSGLVNEGELSVSPSVDFSATPPLLSFPPDTNLFRNVHVTEEMSNELLGKIHPLFKGARGVDGRIDLSMMYFEWPLSESHAAQRRFKGALDLRDLTMTSSGLWGTILQFAKVKERQMEVKDERIEFELKDERIHCSPIRIDIGQQDKMILSGSVGLDKTLDYTASIPVTESMARGVGISAQDYTNYVAGTSIQVPIRGTVDAPDMSSSVLRDMAVDLAKQAARRALQQKAGQALEGLFKK